MASSNVAKHVQWLTTPSKGPGAAPFPEALPRLAKAIASVVRDYAVAPFQGMSRAGGYMLGKNNDLTTIELQGALADALFAGVPGGGTGVANVIKRPQPFRTAIRRAMKKEAKLRGEPFRSKAKDKVGEAMMRRHPEGLTSEDLTRVSETVRKLRRKEKLSDFLRGTFYHGRGTYPGERSSYYKSPVTYTGGRRNSMNTGEPTGMSMSASPEVAARDHFAKTDFYEHDAYKWMVDKRNALEDRNIEVLKEAANLNYNSPEVKKLQKERIANNRKIEKLTDRINRGHGSKAFARVHPRFGARPEDVIIDAAGKRGGKILQDAYLEALERNVFDREDKILKQVYVENVAKMLKDYKAGKFLGMETLAKDLAQNKGFNEELTKILQEKGYKGIAYSPNRMDNEIELKMFNPKDVVHVDMRHHRDPAIKRLFPLPVNGFPAGNRHLDQWVQTSGFDRPSLRDVYTEIPDEKYYKALGSALKKAFKESQ